MLKCGECGKEKKRPAKPGNKRMQELGLKKVKKMISELEEEKIKLYESMGKILSGDFRYDVSDFKGTDWCSQVEVESTGFRETFFIDRETGKNRYD